MVYGLIVFTLLSVLLAGRAASEDEKSQDVTGMLLDLPADEWIVGAVGLGVIALGVYWVRQGVTKKFREELDLGRMSPRARSVMEKLGMA
ncbi:DUF1206 domain-containing protein [Nonomuraea ferruginea]